MSECSVGICHELTAKETTEGQWLYSVAGNKMVRSMSIMS